MGVALTAFDTESKQPVIGFDMGGTSTDVSRYAGEFDHVFESTTAGVTIQAPQVKVNDRFIFGLITIFSFILARRQHSCCRRWVQIVLPKRSFRCWA